MESKTLKTNRKFSPAQVAYMTAKTFHSVCYDAARAYDKEIDAEGERLGLDVPYAILPEDHPMMAKAQQLLDRENAAKKLMYEAAFNLFDWASETTLTKLGTPKQKAQVREMVARVKTMAYVEQHFEDLANISMKLAA